MCRRCGESDTRSSSDDRRTRRQKMLSPEGGFGGDGEKVPCWNFDGHKQLIEGVVVDVPGCGTMLTNADMTVDRIITGWQCYCEHTVGQHQGRCLAPGCKCDLLRRGTYRWNNVRPSCLRCNRGRWVNQRIEKLKADARCRFG